MNIILRTIVRSYSKNNKVSSHSPKAVRTINMEFKGKNIAVLGFGVEGKSAVNFLLKHGAFVTVFDDKPEDQFEKNKIDRLKDNGVEFHLGGFPGEFKGYEVLVRSPGIKPERISNFKFQISNLEITSPTKIFFDMCPAKIIGVTGTKGKGTTSSLIFEMLKLQGLDTYLGGNIGTPALDFLDKLNENSWVVLELSSFQLQDLDKSPHIAVVLMVTSEHLDYHKDTSEYVEAKRNILRFQTPQDFAIVNRDYPASRESDIFTEGKVFQVSREGEVVEGCFVKEGKIVIKFPISNFQFLISNGGLIDRKLVNSNQKTENRSTFASSFAKASVDKKAMADKEQMTEIIETKDILLPGKHNLENVCAAVMAAFSAGVTKQNIIKILKTFKGLEHRLELVDTIKGVRYYDDSFSTTPETAQAAIEAFSEPEVLILGGSSKGSDFTHLGKVISDKDNIKAIIGIGAEWPKIREQFKIKNLKFKIVEGLTNMHDIVKKASELSEFGDVVLLSPACASFDMFKNYKDRGEQFKKEIKLLNSRKSVS